MEALKDEAAKQNELVQYYHTVPSEKLWRNDLEAFLVEFEAFEQNLLNAAKASKKPPKKVAAPAKV